MCIISNVFDHYEPLIPKIEPLQPAGTWPWQPQIDVTELQRLIAEFRDAVAAAKKLDTLMGKPDCLDPEKARLEARVRELEREVELTRLREAIRRMADHHQLCHDEDAVRMNGASELDQARCRARMSRDQLIADKLRALLQPGEDTER